MAMFGGALPMATGHMTDSDQSVVSIGGAYESDSQTLHTVD